jgi:iron complex outermembrane receptor protein
VPIVDDKVLLRLAGDVSIRDGYTKDVGTFFPGKDYDNVEGSMTSHFGTGWVTR